MISIPNLYDFIFITVLEMIFQIGNGRESIFGFFEFCVDVNKRNFYEQELEGFCWPFRRRWGSVSILESSAYQKHYWIENAPGKEERADRCQSQQAREQNEDIRVHLYEKP